MRNSATKQLRTVCRHKDPRLFARQRELSLQRRSTAFDPQWGMRPNLHMNPRMSSRLPIYRQASLLTTPNTTDLPDRTSLKNFTSHPISLNTTFPAHVKISQSMSDSLTFINDQ